MYKFGDGDEENNENTTQKILEAINAPRLAYERQKAAQEAAMKALEDEEKSRSERGAHHAFVEINPAETASKPIPLHCPKPIRPINWPAQIAQLDFEWNTLRLPRVNKRKPSPSTEVQPIATKKARTKSIWVPLPSDSYSAIAQIRESKPDCHDLKNYKKYALALFRAKKAAGVTFNTNARMKLQNRQEIANRRPRVKGRFVKIG